MELKGNDESRNHHKNESCTKISLTTNIEALHERKSALQDVLKYTKDTLLQLGGSETMNIDPPEQEKADFSSLSIPEKIDNLTREIARLTNNIGDTVGNINNYIN